MASHSGEGIMEETWDQTMVPMDPLLSRNIQMIPSLMLPRLQLIFYFQRTLQDAPAIKVSLPYSPWHSLQIDDQIKYQRKLDQN